MREIPRYGINSKNNGRDRHGVRKTRTAAAKRINKLRRMPDDVRYQRITERLSQSPVWVALCHETQAMLLLWCLVGIYHRMGGWQDDGLMCSQRYFVEFGGSARALKRAAAILEGLGLVTVQDHGRSAKSTPYTKARRFVLNVEPWGGFEATNDWRKDSCHRYAGAILRQHRGRGRQLAERLNEGKRKKQPASRRAACRRPKAQTAETLDIGSTVEPGNLHTSDAVGRFTGSTVEPILGHCGASKKNLNGGTP